MSDTDKNETSPKPVDKATGLVPPPAPENQKQRWLKYGANVVLASVLVIVLAIAATYIATRTHAHVDTTEAGMYSLKPQTKVVLKDLKDSVKIVSLYTQAEKTGGETKDAEDYAQRVSDLLDEYKRNSNGKIDVEVIDPVKQPTKVDDLITDVTAKYGGEVKKYKSFLDAYAATKLPAIKKQVTDLAAKVPQTSVQSDGETDLMGQIVQSMTAATDRLDKSKQAIDRLASQKPPNYKGATDSISDTMESLSNLAGQIVKVFKSGDDEKTIPAAVKTYMKDNVAQYEALRKSADDLKDEIGKLGELKLDDVRQKLRERDAILVMGPKDMRTLSFRDVWQTDPNVRRMLSSPDAKIKPRFAGEQQLTSAVLALTQDKKPKIAFVRGGGPPIASGGMGPFSQGGPLSKIADRLREYNFDVLEKDLSGMWAAQAQQRGEPPAPEPSDDDIKDAVWIVIAAQSGPTPFGRSDIDAKLAEHLKAGGSALALFEPRGDALHASLGDWGIVAQPDKVIVHEPVTAAGAPTGDFINEAQRIPYVFVIHEYGDHMLAKPLESLDMPLIAPIPINVTPKDGFESWKLLPVPTDPKTWGESDIETIQENPPTFDAAKDLSGPLWAGAAVQKKGGGRVVAIGSLQFATNQMLGIPDKELLDRGYLVTRFPGSAELFVNSVLWLAKIEPMIAISPAAMDVSRIEPMSSGLQTFWRGGVLLGLLPLAVLAGGVLMYVRRRD